MPWKMTSRGRVGFLQRDCYVHLYCILRQLNRGPFSRLQVRACEPCCDTRRQSAIEENEPLPEPEEPPANLDSSNLFKCFFREQARLAFPNRGN